MVLVFCFFAAWSAAALGQTASISGTLLDPTGSRIAGATVVLSTGGRQTLSSTTGEFGFSDVVPGPFTLTVTAAGFAAKTLTGELHTSERLQLSPATLAIDALISQVNVTPQTQTQIAQAQIQEEEKQLLIGVFPNFFANYDHDAAPLNAKQKLELTAKTWFHPSAFVVNGIIAGVWQAQDTHHGFGQGAAGYAKRYGASFVDYGTMLLLEKVVTPTLFKQDPRYFYKGTGTTGSRMLYAISRTFVCRGDNKKDQFCYSSMLERFGVGFITNYYYPAADRDKAHVIVRNATIGIGFDVLGNLFQEFAAKKLTRKKH